jgi:hypothetical protein
MSKPLIDPAAVARIRADMRAAADGLVTDRIIVLERAVETVLAALEAAR